MRGDFDIYPRCPSPVLLPFFARSSAGLYCIDGVLLRPYYSTRLAECTVLPSIFSRILVVTSLCYRARLVAYAPHRINNTTHIHIALYLDHFTHVRAHDLQPSQPPYSKKNQQTQETHMRYLMNAPVEGENSLTYAHVFLPRPGSRRAQGAGRRQKGPAALRGGGATNAPGRTKGKSLASSGHDRRRADWVWR